jgi:hypothetical protein
LGPVRLFTPYKRKKKKDLMEMENDRKLKRDSRGEDGNEADESCDSSIGKAVFLFIGMLFEIRNKKNYFSLFI